MSTTPILILALSFLAFFIVPGNADNPSLPVVGLVGKPCVSDKCTENAECHDLCDNFDPTTNRTLDHDICWKECLCPVGLGYMTSSNGLCLAPVASSCSSDSSCISGLKCVSQKCTCDPKTSEYSTSKKQCMGRVAHPCIGDEVCVANSECSDLCDNWDRKTNTTTKEDICWKECTCSEGLGFTITPEGHCKSPLGIACENADSCLAEMKCIKGKCACDETLTKWNSMLKRCVGLADTLCVENTFCVQNAHCQHLCDNWDPKTNTTTEVDICENKCLCPADYLAEPEIPFLKNNGHCQAHEGGPCGNSDDHCVNELICVDGKCSCPYGPYQAYDVKENKCITLVGGPCLPGDHAFPCVDGATCTPLRDDDNATTHHCQCDFIFVENSEGRCVPPLEFGDACPHILGVFDNWTCDPRAGLRCVNGHCGCGDKLHIYEDKEKKCVGLVGAFCHKDNECYGEGVCTPRNIAHSLTGTKIAPEFKGSCQCKSGQMMLKNRTCPT